MPDRILRVGILTSDAVNSLGWAAEVFYRRLMSVVDDYGRFDGRETVMRAALYALKIDRVSDSDVGKWIRECGEAGLVRQYTVDSKPYIEVLKFDQRTRAIKSKWPDPPTSAVTCQQLPTSAAVVEVVVEDECEVPVGSAPKNGARHAKVDDSPIVATLPLRDGTKYEVRGSLVTELEPLYPNVDIPRTLGEMKGWLITNPDRLKTRRGAMKFIGGWLQREEEKHGG